MNTDNMKNDNKNKELWEELKILAKEISKIYIEAKKLYAPIIDDIIKTNNKNANEIENILDNLLSFLDDEDMLKLFKELRKYYYSINPEAVYEYIQIYREIWDS